MGPDAADRQSTEDLVTGCRLGDDLSWDRLVARYQRLVIAVPRRLGLSEQDASDVAQATFLSLFEQLDRLEDPSRLASWLMTVARRASWRIIDRTAREATARQHGAIELSDVEDDISAWEFAAWIQEAVAELPEPCRGLLAAMFLDPTEPAYGVIAARIGRSAGSVGPMRSRCLDKLRVRLERDLLGSAAHERIG